MKTFKKTLCLSTALTLIAYAAIQAFAVTAPAFPADDAQEFAFVRGLEAWWQILGPDAFELFRPVKNLLFLVFAGLEPFGLPVVRVLAIGLGLVSYFPVRAFFRRVFPSEESAALSAAVWLLSPTLVSSVAWLSCVNIQVMCAFGAWAFVAHDRERPVLATLALFLACCSYEAAVAVGPGLVLFDFVLRPARFRTRRAWRGYALYAAATLAYLVLRSVCGSAASVNGSFSEVTRLGMIAAGGYFTCQHFLAWFCPFGRFLVFGGYIGGSISPVVLAGAYAVLAVQAALGFSLLRRRPAAAFGLLFALGAFVPLGNFAGLGNGPYGDYYLGFSSMGFALALADAAAWGWARRRESALAFAAAAALVAVRVLAVPEAARWATLWGDADRGLAVSVATAPEAFGNRIFLAQRLCDRGDYAGSLRLCQGLEETLGPESPQLVAVCWMRALAALNGTRDAKAALVWIARAEGLSDRARVRRQAAFYRGCVYEDLLDDTEAAMRYYAAALPTGRWTVDDASAADRLARLKAIGGLRAEAIALWEHALRVRPGDPALAHNLAVAKELP